MVRILNIKLDALKKGIVVCLEWFANKGTEGM